ncbi:hypothetical protein C8250_029055 [Streptomyces sp. So13.3]|uniref:replication-relaxation family protein n=1 Tax=Streptomyces sp. So13.3 TaxID=2136173 RepID=UPI0011073A6E|nr:replication-relaxation family protein [Streptomyces sp. So13.3]QNA75400.1 hypothetical protein C8250_029055 [Streptomyces sp. So13.3]
MNVTEGYLNQLKPHLSDRDLAIIYEVGRFKLMTGSQLERLFFADGSDKSRARNRQAVLRRLTNHSVLLQVGERRVGGSQRGSASFLYTLGIAGQYLAGSTSKRPRRPYSWYEPTIAHFLAVAELYVTLVEAGRPGLFTLLDYQAEPYCWRTFGTRTLKPDAFVQLGVKRGQQRAQGRFFIEVDRAGQYGTKIESKLPQYLAYYHHHRIAEPDRRFPWIIFLAPHDQRVAYLTRLLNEQAKLRSAFLVGILDNPVETLLSTLPRT